MSDRERWIVYPLLFLALGASLRDKMDGKIHIDKIDCSRIRCAELTVVGDDEKPQVALRSSKAGGTVSVIRADDKLDLVLGHEPQMSGLFAETPTNHGPARWSVLGNLGRFQPLSAIEWLSEFPLFDPQMMLDRAAKPAPPPEKSGKAKTKDDAKNK